MNLYKIILSIIIGWFLLRILRFIRGVKIISANKSAFNKNNNKKNNIDAQDADFEDVE